MKFKFTRLSIAIVAFAMLSACSSGGGLLLPEAAPGQAGNYIIGPGDSLQVFVWRNPELSRSVTVRPDGKISSPLITDLHVSGLEAPIIATLIEEELSKYIRTPIVNVIVGSFNSTVDQQIRVIGSATSPRVIPYRSGMTLLDVMIEVQGLSEFADGDNAKIIRNEKGVPTSYVVKLDSLIKDGNIKMNRAVLPGDTLIIPEALF
ncbi:MAG: polysaccharide export outer membrane protein [Gammaproteobacteria bacterium]|jgi:polysaccharide export outer membrane protein